MDTVMRKVVMGTAMTRDTVIHMMGDMVIHMMTTVMVTLTAEGARTPTPMVVAARMATVTVAEATRTGTSRESFST